MNLQIIKVVIYCYLLTAIWWISGAQVFLPPLNWVKKVLSYSGWNHISSLKNFLFYQGLIWHFCHQTSYLPSKAVFHRKSSPIQSSLQLKGVSHQKLHSMEFFFWSKALFFKCFLQSKDVFYWRLSLIYGLLESIVFLHQWLSSIKCLSHQRLCKKVPRCHHFSHKSS